MKWTNCWYTDGCVATFTVAQRPQRRRICKTLRRRVSASFDLVQLRVNPSPYTNLKTYLEYKERGVDTLRAHEKEIAELAEDEAGKAEEESE